jgi:hypothetical protein
MKTPSNFLLRSMLALSFCAALSLTTARAHDGSDDNQCGGDINGTEMVHVDLAMTPTAAAPAGSAIDLTFEAHDDDGVTEAELELRTHSLPPATYSVSVTLKSDGSTVALGTFTVDAEGEGEIEFTTGTEAEDVAQHHDGGGEDNGGDDNDENEATLLFPAGFNPLDIATVTVSDANGTALFTADLTTATTINATIQAAPGAAAPNANGTASINAVMKKGRAKGSLSFVGHALPPRLPVTIAINGAAVKNLKTDKRGDVSLKLTPSGKSTTIAPGVTLANVTAVTLQDQSGNTLLQANF